VQWVARPPTVVARIVLHARFGAPPQDDGTRLDTSGLAAFQADGVERVRRILDHRRGAVLADSVGLGKTHIARALVRAALQAGEKVIVCAPAALRTHWRRQLRRLEGWDWLSHSALSRGATVRTRAQLVVVDEAHAFRNPATHRYAALAGLCTDARVLLLTATPVNNSIMDFYHLLRLFSARHDFADVGVTDLLTAVESAGADAGPLRRVIEAVVVRRTRELIEHSGALLPAAAAAGTEYASAVRTASVTGTTLRFPRREPVRLLHYDLALAYPGLMNGITGAVAALRFPAHGRAWRQGPARAGGGAPRQGPAQRTAARRGRARHRRAVSPS
jgi:hypothetical protein